MESQILVDYGRVRSIIDAAMPAPTRRPVSPMRKTSRKDRIRVPRELDTRGKRELNPATPTGKKDRIRSGTTRARMQRG